MLCAVASGLVHHSEWQVRCATACRSPAAQVAGSCAHPAQPPAQVRVYPRQPSHAASLAQPTVCAPLGVVACAKGGRVFFWPCPEGALPRCRARLNVKVEAPGPRTRRRRRRRLDIETRHHTSTHTKTLTVHPRTPQPARHPNPRQPAYPPSPSPATTHPIRLPPSPCRDPFAAPSLAQRWRRTGPHLWGLFRRYPTSPPPSSDIGCALGNAFLTIALSSSSM